MAGKLVVWTVPAAKLKKLRRNVMAVEWKKFIEISVSMSIAGTTLTVSHAMKNWCEVCNVWLIPVLPLQKGSWEESEFHLQWGSATIKEQHRCGSGAWGNSEQNKLQDLSYEIVICYKDATRVVLIPYFLSLKGGWYSYIFPYITSVICIV